MRQKQHMSDRGAVRGGPPSVRPELAAAGVQLVVAHAGRRALQT